MVSDFINSINNSKMFKENDIVIENKEMLSIKKNNKEIITIENNINDIDDLIFTLYHINNEFIFNINKNNYSNIQNVNKLIHKNILNDVIINSFKEKFNKQEIINNFDEFNSIFIDNMVNKFKIIQKMIESNSGLRIFRNNDNLIDYQRNFNYLNNIINHFEKPENKIEIKTKTKLKN